MSHGGPICWTGGLQASSKYRPLSTSIISTKTLSGDGASRIHFPKCIAGTKTTKARSGTLIPRPQSRRPDFYALFPKDHIFGSTCPFFLGIAKRANRRMAEGALGRGNVKVDAAWSKMASQGGLYFFDNRYSMQFNTGSTPIAAQ
jgi:hypothetical protein